MSDTSLSYYYIDCSTILIQYYNTFAVSFTLMMTIWKHVHDKEHNTTQVQGRVRYSNYNAVVVKYIVRCLKYFQSCTIKMDVK